jgi:Mn2+/Fe2+ NRAMP family transporter
MTASDSREPQATSGDISSPESSPEAIRRRRRRRLRHVLYAALAFAGPGLIAANAGNDAGGIATYASAGAQFGYRTLFVMLVVTIALVVVQEMCARLGAYTGEGLGSLIREQFSIRISAFALIAFLVANLGLVVSEFAGIAAALSLVGVSRYISVPAAAVAIWSLVVFGTYRYAERLFLILSLAFLTYPVAAILARPNWSEAAGNLLWPHVVASRGFLLLSVALIGTTITPYMQFYIAGAVADKGVGPADYKAERIDTVGGAIFADLISVFIIIATAAAIHVRAPLHSAAQAAQALKPVAGRFAEQLFALGLLGASALAAAVVPLSTAYAISEAAGAERSVGRRFREAPLFLGLFTGQIFLGAAVALIPGNLIQLLINAQLLNGIITPVLLTYVLILASRRRVLGGAANGAVYRVVAAACVAVVAIMAAAALTVTVLGWFGVRLPRADQYPALPFSRRPHRADLREQTIRPGGRQAGLLLRCAAALGACR